MLKQKSWAVPIKAMSLRDVYYMSLPGGQGLMLVETGSADADSVEPMVQELLALGEQPINIDGINTKIGFRIGCAPFSPHEHSLFECFRRAQVALLSAQRAARGFAIYSDEQDSVIKQQLSLLSDLRVAIEEQQFAIYIQPQYRLADQSLVGGEVLVRWIHPDKGFISPGLFIPLAEQSQQVFDITRQVLSQT